MWNTYRDSFRLFCGYCLKVHSMTKKVTKTMLQKSFFCISCLIIYPPLFTKWPLDVFISILKLLNFHSRNHRRANFIENVRLALYGFRWELNLYLIASIKDIYVKKKV